MVRLLRRIVLASLLVGGAAFVVRRRRGPLPTAATSTSDSSHSSSTAWPPIAAEDDLSTATPRHAATDRTRDLRPFVEVSPDAAPDAPAGASPTWVQPVDGQCPDGYPIKANDNSRIYHVPGGRFYDRTVPERCYADAEAAAADGYRAAKA